MSLGPNDLVLCSGTLPQATFQERAEAAAEAGFSAISLFATDYERARHEGQSDADLRAILRDTGLRVAELDPLMGWLPNVSSDGLTEEGVAFSHFSEEDFYRMAEVLEAHSLNAISIAESPPSTERITAAFAGLCDRAAAHGLQVHLEFLPWTHIPDAPGAFQIVEAANRPNGGVMFDVWHHFRSGLPDEKLRDLPGAKVIAVQLNDAPSESEPNLVDETLHRRLLPGEGDIDLVGLLRWLDTSGCTAPLGVEIFSDALAALPAKEAARRAADSARRIVKEARR